MTVVNTLTGDPVELVPQDGTYVNAAGDPFQLVKGQPMPPGLTLRSEPAAPENRAVPEGGVETPEVRTDVPENRARKGRGV